MNGTLDTSLGMQADTLNSVGMLFGLYFRREGIFDFQSYFEGYRPTSIRLLGQLQFRLVPAQGKRAAHLPLQASSEWTRTSFPSTIQP
jgi:hypothetical protein